MITSGSVITAPINVAEPYKVLGVAPIYGYDVGYICSNRHGKINKWSVRKPIHVPNVVRMLTDGEIKLYDCGLTVFGESSIMAAANRVKDGCDWSYNAPQGGIGSPFRITDFNGYDHGTQPWCQLTVDVDGKKQIRLSGMENGMQMIGHWVNTLSELFSSPDAYVGALLFRKNSDGNVSSAALYVMGALSDFDWEHDLQISHMLAETHMGTGDVYVIPVMAMLAAVPQELPYMVRDNALTSAVTIYPLPSELVDVYIKTVAEQKTYPYDVGVSVELTDGNTQVHWSDSQQGIYAYSCDFKFSLIISNAGAVPQKVTLEVLAPDGALLNEPISVVETVVAGGYQGAIVTGTLRTVAGYKEDNAVSLLYRLSAAGCDGVETGSWYIEE